MAKSDLNEPTIRGQKRARPEIESETSRKRRRVEESPTFVGKIKKAVFGWFGYFWGSPATTTDMADDSCDDEVR
jgi:hypothetical protein